MTPTTAASKKHTVTLSEEQVVNLLRQTQGERSLRDFAVELGVSPSYLSDIYNQNRRPGDKILARAKALGHFDVTKTRRIMVEYRQASR